jgi:hypothetical protein
MLPLFLHLTDRPLEFEKYSGQTLSQRSTKKLLSKDLLSPGMGCKQAKQDSYEMRERVVGTLPDHLIFSRKPRNSGYSWLNLVF